ncbi:LOW QUALITY PROTEIN: hypothetical protein CRUP_020703 [Coryphaenoides rupestris]|nr:LOW QUALITY PROTEIN: hypothetical protein CRUP_020703 [Coryphaenoides rupestris]
MGKKSKVGKARKDKFYHLAKETGYRSRSSFKLIQLNRKFQFLQKARVLVDLCAAPGGWLQVASKFMPISSLIVGVDLVPIRAIPNVVTLQEDITTDKCRQAIRKELQTWKVDVVLNDGAPNVGANWQHDAFTQAHLTLMALKLACDFLNKGGSFITKVFRSKDYQPLLWIFQQFFKKVQATKPQASRNESAEIFVVCQGFLAPDKIDSKFFDPKHAFKEVVVQAKTVKELIPVKKPKAEGYTDVSTLTEFLKAENPVDFLGKASTITLDSLELESQEDTTEEVKECCRDIKVLGRKDLRLLLNWRTKLRRYLSKKLKDEAKQRNQEISLSSDEDDSDTDVKPDAPKKVAVEGDTGGDKEGDAAEEDAEEEEAMVKQLAELKAEEVADLRRKKKRLLKERRKQRERVELKMDLPGVSIADNNDTAMFCLSSIKAKALGEISKGNMLDLDTLADGEEDFHISEDEIEEDKMSLASELDEDDMNEVEEKEQELEKKEKQKKKVAFKIAAAAEEEEEEEEEEEGQGGLLVDLEDKDVKREQETNLWFSKVRRGLKEEGEEEEETAVQPPDVEDKAGPSQAAQEGSDSDSDSDSSDDETEISAMKRGKGAGGLRSKADKDDFQRSRVLDAEGLALAKRSRDLMDDSFHRFAQSEGQWEVPEWFFDDERSTGRSRCRRWWTEYKQKWKEINARPIKRVAEAKARKKRRMLKKMETAKKKAEAVVDTVDIL